MIEDSLKIQDEGVTFSKLKLSHDITAEHSPSSRFLCYKGSDEKFSIMKSEQNKNSAYFSYKIDVDNKK